VRVLVACEFSGVVRDAFTDAGHDALSCDLLPTDSPGAHYIGDVRDVLYDGWDLMIAHPPCTYLANSGVRWLHEKPGRWELLDQGAELFKTLLEAPIDRIAVENPIPHKYAVERIGRKYDQLIQPYQFGHPETKATCLWLKNLDPLKETNNVLHLKESLPDKDWQRIHYLSPGPERTKLRSKTYSGIARAMVEQWHAKSVSNER